MQKSPVHRPGISHDGADDEIRTRDPHLGKVMLYQLSHVRSIWKSTGGSAPGQHAYTGSGTFGVRATTTVPARPARTIAAPTS
jgi:hypothetical protein